MALNAMGLGFLFTAKDLASGIMTKVQGNFNKVADTATKKSAGMKQAFAQTALGLGVMAVGIGGLAAGFEAANKFGEFEQGLAGVRAVMRASDKDFAALKNSALDAGIATQFTPVEAVEGLTELATAGQTATQAVQTLIPVLDLSAGSLGKLGVAGAAQAVVGTLNSYALTADHAADVTDRLLRITELSNFQARDFETGLSKAAAKGGIFNQSLNDVLITMGLLRNRNIDASSASTAYGEALRRLATDTHASKAASKAGVEIYEKGTGKLRQLVDITQDFADKTANMTDKQRNALIVQAYGARGLLTFSAIQKAQFTQTENGITTTYRGAEAIAHMRKTMEGAGGSAARFRSALLDTFQGQKTLLHGSLVTLGIVAGEGFAQVFRPVVEGVIFGINMLIRVIKSTPPALKQFFAGLWVLTSALFAIVGTIMVTDAAMTLLGISISSLFDGVAEAIAPVIGVLALFALGFVALRYAYEENLGGLADMSRKSFADIKLAWDGLTQLFSQGGFSGSVREELNKAGNEGVRNFAITVYVWAERIKNFFKGISTGFGDSLRENEGVFTEFRQALQLLGTVLSRLFDTGVDVDANRQKWTSWGESGKSVGHELAGAALLIVRGLTWVVVGIAHVLQFFDYLSDTLEDVGPFNAIGDSLSEIGKAFETLSGKTSDSQDGVDDWQVTWLMAVRAVATVVRIALAPIAGIIGGIVDSFMSVNLIVNEIFGTLINSVLALGSLLTGDTTAAWGSFKVAAFSAIMAVKGAVMLVMQVIARMVDMLVNAAGGKGTAVEGLKGFDVGLTQGIGGTMGITQDAAGNNIVAPGGASDTPAIDRLLARPGDRDSDAGVKKDLQSQLPGVAEGQAAAGANADFAAQIADMRKALGDSTFEANLTTNLKLDEDVLATAVHKVRRKRNATSFDAGADTQD